jgi:hypothetical protein
MNGKFQLECNNLVENRKRRSWGEFGCEVKGNSWKHDFGGLSVNLRAVLKKVRNTEENQKNFNDIWLVYSPIGHTLQTNPYRKRLAKKRFN